MNAVSDLRFKVKNGYWACHHCGEKTRKPYSILYELSERQLGKQKQTKYKLKMPIT
ncbi:hypothetical protein JCM19055_51 [Geomicrobium sp. JCM 19055]|nr:hypothetical protein JCM19055_51 [Geomicrobium sp. JCM 19055]